MYSGFLVDQHMGWGDSWFIAQWLISLSWSNLGWLLCTQVVIWIGIKVDEAVYFIAQQSIYLSCCTLMPDIMYFMAVGSMFHSRHWCAVYNSGKRVFWACVLLALCMLWIKFMRTSCKIGFYTVCESAPPYWCTKTPLYVRALSKYHWSIYRTSGKCCWSIYRTSRKRHGTLQVIHKVERSSPMMF